MASKLQIRRKKTKTAVETEVHVLLYWQFSEINNAFSHFLTKHQHHIIDKSTLCAKKAYKLNKYLQQLCSNKNNNEKDCIKAHE